MNRTAQIGDDVSRAAREILAGQLVAIPTETVYGLAADALNRQAVARIFEAKQRPKFDPLIVHIASSSWLDGLVTQVPKTARKLIEQFSPGPLTVVLPKADCVPDLVTSGLPSVAVRIPDHPLTLQLLEAVRKPLAAPSANLFGRTSPTTALHVADQLGSVIPYILDGGSCQVGIESTIVSCTAEDVFLLRPGGITIEQLEQVLGTDTVCLPDANNHDQAMPTAPGQLKQHYAPQTPMIIQQQPCKPAGYERVGLLMLQKQGSADGFDYIEELSTTGNLAEAAANFFAAIRRLDNRDLELIIATRFPAHGLGHALNDRLSRAVHCTNDSLTN